MPLTRTVVRRVTAQVDRFRRGGRSAVGWALRLTVAAVASYVVALAFFPGTEPLLAPLTALLVVQVTPMTLLTSGLDRVVAVVAGVSLAVGFSVVVPLEWWSLGLLIAASIMIGQALRLRSNLIEVAISGMLVLGVGSYGAESAASQRIAETLVGAAVGIAANLLFPPKVPTGDAGNAIMDVAEALGRLLERAADEVPDTGTRGNEVAALARDWLEEARHINHEIPRAGAALLRVEQARRLNVRALGTPNAGPGLRQGLEALEHSAVALRSMFRSVHDATSDPEWPDDEVGDAILRNTEQVLRELATAVTAFGQLVRVEAQQRRSADPELARVRDALEGLREGKARLRDLLLMDTPPVLADLNRELLTGVQRLLTEMDLDERMRRELRLHPAPPRFRRPGR